MLSVLLLHLTGPLLGICPLLFFWRHAAPFAVFLCSWLAFADPSLVHTFLVCGHGVSPGAFATLTALADFAVCVGLVIILQTRRDPFDWSPIVRLLASLRALAFLVHFATRSPLPLVLVPPFYCAVAFMFSTIDFFHIRKTGVAADIFMLAMLGVVLYSEWLERMHPHPAAPCGVRLSEHHVATELAGRIAASWVFTVAISASHTFVARRLKKKR